MTILILIGNSRIINSYLYIFRNATVKTWGLETFLDFGPWLCQHLTPVTLLSWISQQFAWSKITLHCPKPDQCEVWMHHWLLSLSELLYVIFSFPLSYIKRVAWWPRLGSYIVQRSKCISVTPLLLRLKRSWSSNLSALFVFAWHGYLYCSINRKLMRFSSLQ